jgi:hypothetical protein
MTEAKPTPGPWTITAPQFGFSVIYGPKGEVVFGLASGGPDEKRPDDVCDANAHLIAAAPELLKYLSIFLGHDDRFQVSVGGNPIAVDRMLEEARAALLKAQGRSA